jgi:hypothetical protein
MTISLPAVIRPQHIATIVEQLRELADGVAITGGYPNYEPMAREELLRIGDKLEEVTLRRLEERSADGLIMAYDQFREAVIEYLRSADR